MATPADFLQYAESIVGRVGSTDFELRMAVGRAYYGVFHKLAERFNVLPRRDIQHVVHNALFNQRRHVPYWQLVARDTFEKLRDGRVTADYRLSEPISVHEARVLVGRARQLFTLLDK